MFVRFCVVAYLLCLLPYFVLFMLHRFTLLLDLLVMLRCLLRLSCGLIAACRFVFVARDFGLLAFVCLVAWILPWLFA